MKTFIVMLTFVVGILFSSQAYAAINYFDCKITTQGHESEYKVTTDEDKGQVTYEVLSNGSIFTRPATFTADSVIWRDAGASILRIQFSISRIDLSFEVSVFIGGEVSPQPRRGQCTKLETPSRVF